MEEMKKSKIALIQRTIFSCIVAVLTITSIIYTLQWQEPTYHVFALTALGCLCVAVAALPFRMKRWLEIAVLILSPAVTFFAAESMTHDPWKMKLSPILFSIAAFMMFYLLLIGLTGNIRHGSNLTTIGATIVGTSNYIVILCRNVPILPWDIKSLKTAVSVSDNYEMKTTYRVLLCFLILLLIICIQSHSQLRMKKWQVRLASVMLSVAMILSLNTCTHQETFVKKYMTAGNLFTQKFTYRDNGFVLSFMMNLQYMNIKKPTNYNAENLKDVFLEAEKTYEEEHADTLLHADEIQPNIIVIMDEAFTDLAYVGDFATEDADGNLVDYMPFIHSLMEDDSVTSGTLHVSVCGGNTANSEFEALSGNTMCFLPTGSVAYQQYISEELPTLATVLAGKGYQTYGLHPYAASGWNRNTVYPLLGLENTVFKNEFNQGMILRKYISDRCAFEKIEELDRQTEGPEFYFLVTMQNHGGYSEIFENSPVEIFLSDIRNHPATENYLTLVSKTDEAFKKLCGYYAASDEPTMIVLYGDHQPSDFVTNCILRKNGKQEDTLTATERECRYTVPFVIWTNYDTGVEAVQYDNLSVNYLSTVIMEQANLKMTPYQMYLANLKEQYPVITANGYMNEAGEMIAYKEKTAPEALKTYEQVQFNYLHDHQKNNTEYYQN